MKFFVYLLMLSLVIAPLSAQDQQQVVKKNVEVRNNNKGNLILFGVMSVLFGNMLSKWHSKYENVKNILVTSRGHLEKLKKERDWLFISLAPCAFIGLYHGIKVWRALGAQQSKTNK